MLVGMLVGVLVGTRTNWLDLQLIFAAVSALIGVLIAGWTGWRKPAEQLRWSWSAFTAALRSKLVDGLISGLIYGPPCGLLGFELADDRLDGLLDGILSGLSIGLGIGLSLGLFLGLFLGLYNGLTAQEIADRTVPNQGVRRSLRGALLFGVIYGLGGWLIFFLVGELLFGLIYALGGDPTLGVVFGVLFGVILGPVGGLIAGLAFGLRKGGLAWLQHYILRLLLYKNGLLPWRDRDLIAFLDGASDRILLRRVGGGYTFVHRLLQEHFADKYKA
jgi:hypothetical protein